MTPAEKTRRWVEDFVVHHSLCPFAARPLRRGLVDTVEIPGVDIETVFFAAWAQVQRLVVEEPDTVETILCVMTESLADFSTFLDFVATLEEYLEETGASELVQLAHFHPDYLFAGVAADDPGNETNRSPWPVVQLLRVESVAAAVAAYGAGAVEEIPERNVALLRRLRAS